MRVHERTLLPIGDREDPLFTRQQERELPHHENDAALLFAQNARPQITRVDATSATRWNDDVLYLGMNTVKTGNVAQNDLEWNNLRSFAKAERVTSSRTGVVDGFDLTKKDDIEKLVAKLGVARAVVNVIWNADKESREELAGLAKVLARGERGESVPSRWVLSGHTGDVVRDGASDNCIDVADIRALARAMPRGAAYVEDILISGCYSGSKTQLEAWKDAFPNLRSAWGYGTGTRTEADKSPTGAWAVKHMREWERSTRGRTNLTSAIQTAGYAFPNVSYWNGTYHAAISHR